MYKDVDWCPIVLGNGIGYIRHCATFFGTVRLFGEFFSNFFPGSLHGQ